jgi:PAS domain S-box-containing protein
MQIFAFLSLISSIIVLVLGIFVFSTDQKRPLNQVFLFLCIMAFFWAFTESMLRDADSISSAYLWLKLTAFWTFVPAATLHFILFFTKSDFVRKDRWFYFLIYVPAALFSIIELTTNLITTTPVLRYWGYTYGYSPNPFLFLVELAWAFGILVVSLLIITRHYFLVPDIQEKNQTRYILAGISVVVIVSIISFLVLPAVQMSIPELSTIFFMFFSGMIGYAIQKHELFIISPATAADNIVSTMTDSLILLDNSHTIISVNEATPRILQFPKEDLIGLSFSAIFSTLSDSKTILSKISSGEPVTDFETAYRAKNGATVPISFSGSVIRNANGDSAGIVCISRDITRRKRYEEALRENEKRFRDLAEQFPELMLEADVHGIPTFINRYAYDVLGYSEEDVRNGFTIFDLIIPEERERIRQNFTKILHGEILRGNEYTALKKDGTQFPVILYSAPIISLGKITGRLQATSPNRNVRKRHCNRRQENLAC